MWSLGALYFFTHYYIRVAPSVIVTDLMHDFKVGALAIGNLAAAFYVPYVCAQIPYGMLVDRFGVRYPLLICVLLAGAATWGFSQAQSIEACYAYRFVFGAVAAGGFVSALKLATNWLPPNQLASAVGLTQGLGMFGGVLGTQLVAVGLVYMDWRSLTWIMALSCFVLALLIAFFLRSQPEQPSSQEGTAHHRASWADSVAVFRSPATWLASLFCGLHFVPMQLFGESWGPHYLEMAQHHARLDAGSAISMVFVGWCLGAPLSGMLADRVGRRPIMQLGSLLCLLSMLLILYVPLSSLPLHGLVFLFGLGNSGLVAAYTIVGELHPKRSAGLALAIANMATVLLGAVFSPAVGAALDYLWQKEPIMVDHFPVYAVNDYYLVFSLLPVCSFLALALTMFIPETYTPPSKQ